MFLLSGELASEPQDPGILKTREASVQAMKVHEVTCLNFWAFCKWHMWHFDFTGYIFVFSFYFTCLASSPRQKTYLHLSPQSRLFPGILSVVMVLPSVILTHAWACLSLSSGHMEPSQGQVKPGAWPQHALRVRAGVHPEGLRPASRAQKAASFWRACHGAAGPIALSISCHCWAAEGHGFLSNQICL